MHIHQKLKTPGILRMNSKGRELFNFRISVTFYCSQLASVDKDLQMLHVHQAPLVRSKNQALVSILTNFQRLNG